MPPSRLARLAPLAAAVVAGVLVLAGCNSSGVATPTDPVLAKGQTIYQNRCQNCHGARGQGGTGFKLGGGVSAQKFPNIADMEKVIREGRPRTAMPAWQGVLSDEEINAVARYAQSLPG